MSAKKKKKALKLNAVFEGNCEISALLFLLYVERIYYFKDTMRFCLELGLLVS